MVRPLVLAVVLAVVSLSACGGEAATCDELADEAIVLIQDLIDEVESAFGAASVEDIVAGGDLPPVDDFRAEADEVDERAEELECSETQMRRLTAARIGDLEASTPVGRFIIDAFEAGGF